MILQPWTWAGSHGDGPLIPGCPVYFPGITSSGLDWMSACVGAALAKGPSLRFYFS